MPGQNPSAVLLDYPKRVKPGAVRWSAPGWSFNLVANTNALVNGSIVYQPIFVEEDTTFIRVGCRVTTLRAAATLDLRLFADNDGAPGALIEDFGNVSLAAAASVEIVIATFLVRGYYWLAYRTDAAGAGATLRGIEVTSGYSSPFTDDIATIGTTPSQMYSVISAWADPAPAPTNHQSVAEAILWYREN